MGRSLGTGLRGFKDALTSEHGDQPELIPPATRGVAVSTDVLAGDQTSR
jgi:hypothetical protein